MRVVLASHNAHKLVELTRIVGPLVPGLELVGYDGPEPRETGRSFAENALLKARAAALHTGLAAIADDSGISVDIMGGSPGIFSARWGGPARSDQANVDLLLWQLSDISEQSRSGAFVCAAALVTPEGQEHVFVEKWHGSILEKPSGGGGFGYDPIFRPEGEQRSAAEMTAAEKDAVSHRRLAFTALAPSISALG